MSLRDNLSEEIKNVINSGNWCPLFRKLVVQKWFEKHLNIFFNISDKEVWLKTEIKIELPLDVSNSIVRSYLHYEEIGGVIFCQLVKSEDEIKAVGKKFIPIENAVELYFIDYKKKGSYFPEVNLYSSALSDNFTKENVDEILFPIFLHSHPSITSNAPNDQISWDKMALSGGDIGVANRFKILVGGYQMPFMNVVLTGDKYEHRVLYFGKNVTPFKFEDIISRNSLKGAADVVEDIENGFLKGMTGIFLSVTYVFTKLANQIRTNGNNYKNQEVIGRMEKTLNDSVSNKEYFAKIEKFKSTIVTIPKSLKNSA